jgi:hypothetical protein
MTETKIIIAGKPYEIPEGWENDGFSRKPDGSYQLNLKRVERQKGDGALIADYIRTVTKNIYLEVDGSEAASVETIPEFAIEKPSIPGNANQLLRNPDKPRIVTPPAKKLVIAGV